MRADHYAPPRKWISEYRRAIRIGDTAFKLYCYCENGIESHRTGLYFVTAESIATMIGEEPETVEVTFDDLEATGLAFRDRANELVYVPAVCEDQFRWKAEPKGNDWRVVEARRHIGTLPPSPLVAMFLQRWPIFAPAPSPLEAPSKPLPRVIEGSTTSSMKVGASRSAPDGDHGRPYDDTTAEIQLGGAA